MWISVLSGFILTAAFAPFYFSFATGIVSIVMLNAWLKCRPWQAARLGYVFGLSYFGSSIYWVYFSLHDYGGASVGFAMLATILFVALLALYYAVLGWLVAYYSRYLSNSFLCLLLYPSLWVLFEYLRSSLLTGFPWNLLGQALVDSPFSGVLAIFGVFGGSWLIVFTSVWIRDLWYRRQTIPTGRLAGLAVILVLAGGSGFIVWTHPQGQEIKVGIVQSGIPQGVKFDPKKMRDIIQTHRNLTEDLADSDLVVWSETAIPAYYQQLEEDLILPLWRTIKEAGGKSLLIGAFVQDQQTNAVYNSLVNVGETPQIYHKRHLVPFGEYVPLRSLLEIFNRYIMIPMSDLSPGKERPLLEIDGRQVGVSICYEAAFGSELVQALPEATYLVNVSNDSWFGDSIAPHQHLQIARARAIETGRDMIRATSTGISAVIDYNGFILARSDQFKEATLVSRIQPRAGLTPYGRWHDWAILGLIMTLIIISLIKGYFLGDRRT